MAGYAAMAADPYLNGYGVLTAPVPDSDTAATAGQPGAVLSNSLNSGPQGAPIEAGGGRRQAPFDDVGATNGSTLTYDRQHAIGRFSAKHALQQNTDSYYGWSGVRSDVVRQDVCSPEGVARAEPSTGSSDVGG